MNEKELLQNLDTALKEKIQEIKNKKSEEERLAWMAILNENLAQSIKEALAEIKNGSEVPLKEVNTESENV